MRKTFTAKQMQAAIELAEGIWNDEGEWEAYDNFIIDGNDPRNTTYYLAGVVLGLQKRFKEDIAAYDESEEMAKAIDRAGGRQSQIRE